MKKCADAADDLTDHALGQAVRLRVVTARVALVYLVLLQPLAQGSCKLSARVRVEPPNRFELDAHVDRGLLHSSRLLADDALGEDVVSVSLHKGCQVLLATECNREWSAQVAGKLAFVFTCFSPAMLSSAHPRHLARSARGVVRTMPHAQVL